MNKFIIALVAFLITLSVWSTAEAIFPRTAVVNKSSTTEVIRFEDGSIRVQLKRSTSHDGTRGFCKSEGFFYRGGVLTTSFDGAAPRSIRQYKLRLLAIE